MELFSVNVMELFSRVLGQNSSSIERVREKRKRKSRKYSIYEFRQKIKVTLSNFTFLVIGPLFLLYVLEQ